MNVPFDCRNINKDLNLAKAREQDCRMPRMKKKRHVMQPPYTSGDLFAVQITKNAWGYCRMRRGMGVEIPALFTCNPGVPKADWTAGGLQRWLFYIFLEVREADPLMIPVGNVPFASEEEAVMPPTYRDPDNIEPRYTIEEKGIYRYTSNPADLKGIAKQVTLIPRTLGSFLTEQYHNGALQKVEVRKAE
jgi:hypothetical protein